MKFFETIFKKKISSYNPVNRLETMLQEAAGDAAKRPEFYRMIFHFDLLCLGEVIDHPNGSKLIRFQTSQQEGYPIIYAFTSESALGWYLSKTQQPPGKYVGLRTHTLFEMIQGKMGVVLNSGHDYGKSFSPFEIHELLKDSNLKESELTVPAGQEYMIGQPAEPPKLFLEALQSYSKKTHQIKEIYFGLLATQQGDLQFICLLDFNSGTIPKHQDEIFKDLITISKETLDPGKIINFGKLDGSEFYNAVQSGILKPVLLGDPLLGSVP